jgi:hypothetical protein
VDLWAVGGCDCDCVSGAEAAILNLTFIIPHNKCDYYMYIGTKNK